MCRPISTFISSWITTELTKQPRSETGLPNGPAFTCISLRPTAPGLTWSKDGLQKSQTNGFAAAYSEASKNSKRPFAHILMSTTKIQNPSSGPKLLTKFSPAWRASLNAPARRHSLDLSHEPMGQETSATRGNLALQGT